MFVGLATSHYVYVCYAHRVAASTIEFLQRLQVFSFFNRGIWKSRGRGHSNDYSGSYNLFVFDVDLICFGFNLFPRVNVSCYVARSEGFCTSVSPTILAIRLNHSL